jgi:F0F1-type ATP synthase epsilon subunit
MSATFAWSVATPDGTVASGESVFLVVPTSRGELGVMAAHAALASDVAPGELRVTEPGESGAVRSIPVGAGVIEVRGNAARILVDRAGRPAADGAGA